MTDLRFRIPPPEVKAVVDAVEVTKKKEKIYKSRISIHEVANYLAAVEHPKIYL